VLLIDSNVYFTKRLGDALKREGFEGVSRHPGGNLHAPRLRVQRPSVHPLRHQYAREKWALGIARHNSRGPKNPICHHRSGDGSQRALMEAFQAVRRLH